MKKIVSLAGILALLFLFSCAKNGDVQKNAKILKATVSLVMGNVTLLRSDQAGKITVKAGMQILPDDVIITGANSKVHVVLENQGIIQIVQNSRIVMSSLALKNDGSADQKIAVQTGRIILGLKKLQKDSAFNVETPTAVAGVRGTSFMVDVEDSANNAFPFFVQVNKNRTLTTKVAVLSGAVEFQNPSGDKSVMINPLKAAILHGADFDKVEIVNIDRMTLDMMQEIKDFTEIKKLKMDEITEEISGVEPEIKNMLNTDLKTKSQIKKSSEQDLQSQENKLKDDVKAQEKEIEKAKVRQKGEKKYIKDESSF